MTSRIERLGQQVRQTADWAESWGSACHDSHRCEIPDFDWGQRYPFLLEEGLGLFFFEIQVFLKLLALLLDHFIASLLRRVVSTNEHRGGSRWRVSVGGVLDDPYAVGSTLIAQGDDILVRCVGGKVSRVQRHGTDGLIDKYAWLLVLDGGAGFEELVV